MKYGELIQFQPIGTIIQLRNADQLDAARQLVSSYVISSDMRERLVSLVFPQLQFDMPSDNKGLMIVGNYGTGKSHLMSVVSAIAERAELLGELKDSSLVDAARTIAGKFKVIRTEIGATEMSLREIITSQLEDQLAAMGVHYTFPAAHLVHNNKGPIEEMMAAFHQVFGDDTGLLLVVDELLDYLRGRNETQLVLDLGFLREIGEVMADLKFRFMAGVQEAIFDSSRFEFASRSLMRVKDRFTQVLIARTDVTYVVAELLLRKTPEQMARVREYLLPFARYYGNMNERIEEFVRLFPVHPDYIDTFERVTAVEKREILRTISNAIKGLVNEDVPEDMPGVLTYDQYWAVLRENAAYRSLPDVKAVLDRSQHLEGLIKQAFTRPLYRPLAVRIIHALSVHRLTTGDISAPVGVTVEHLRDALCLYQKGVENLGGVPADDLHTLIETVLKEILRTVNGQFISKNDDNGQYYLDLKKDTDYDAQIVRRADTLDNDKLDSAYFNALQQILERTDNYYPGTHRAWEYELQWLEKQSPRSGYMFFGTPNQRSTAQPDRDFYLYFVQLENAPSFTDQKKQDEVFFRLTGANDTFRTALRLYAGAQDLASTASGTHKAVYEQKATVYRRTLVKWLQENITTAFSVTYTGKTQSLADWLQQAPKASYGANAAVRDLVNVVSAVCLALHFLNDAREYPAFSVMITSDTRPQAAQDALRLIAGLTKTKQATAVLSALELLDGDRLAPDQSRYARYVLDLLAKKAAGQVVNRKEIVVDDYLAPSVYRLESEWTMVVLAALVYAGHLVLAMPGRIFEAGDLQVLANTPVRELARGFTHVERSKEWNLPVIKALFELLRLPPGYANDVTMGKVEAVQELQSRRTQVVDQIVIAVQALNQGINFWGHPLLDQAQQNAYQSKLQTVQSFLESLQGLNAPGKFKSFQMDKVDVDVHAESLSKLDELENLHKLVRETATRTAYLSTAEALLDEEHPWVSDVKALRYQLLEQVTDPARRNAPGFRHQLQVSLSDLKKKYIDQYLVLHRMARLNVSEDSRKAKLLHDPRLENLKKLTAIDMMPSQQLTDWQHALAGVKSCFTLTEQMLESSPLCPACSFRPTLEGTGSEAAALLASLDDDLDRVHQSWTEVLVTNLTDAATQAKVALLNTSHRTLIDQFVQSRSLPGQVSAEFTQAVKEVLADLTPVPVRADDIRAALLKGGSPATKAELQKRFDQFLAGLGKGKNPDYIRIILE